MTDSFVHLHVHTVYSLLDGFSNVKKLVKRAKQMDMPALAITDHGTMFGVMEFYNAAQEQGIKPLIGIETYMSARGMKDRDVKLDKKSSHLLLLAENEVGYRNLLKIATAAQLDGFYYFPRIDHEFLAEHSEGLIATSGCMSAEIPRTLLDENPQEAVRKMNWYYDVFGPDRFYVELQSHNIKELTDLNKKLVELGARYSAKFVATNDVHYIEPEDAKYQDILLAIQTGTLLSDPNRMRYDSQTFYLRSPQEMKTLFAEVPQAISNTLEIAERCKVDLGFKGYHLPEFPVPDGYNPKTYLHYLCEQGLEQRYGARKNEPVIRERLAFELGVIDDMGFDAYFLIVWDLCRYARENGIWYNTRGSAAGSIVAYTLFITLVDPIHHQLLFERFLNPGRISMPDIDLDFRDDRRSEMLEYCARKYGDDKVAQIITFGTMAARGALRDVARVMDISIPEVDRVAKLVPNVPGKAVGLQEAVDTVPDLKALYASDPKVRELVDTAIHMEGVVRNAGTHAAGVVIGDRPLTDYLPLHRPTSGSEETPIKTVTQFEMGILDSLGMLKVDFLGLSTLTVMARACDVIKQRYGVEFTLDNIPTDDPDTFKMMGRGQTAGIFQLEGSGMTRWVIEMKPRSLDNIIAMVALYRPGPMDFIPSYIKRMHGEEPIEYRHPSLEPIFCDTYGIPVYQEQIMRAAVELAGYTRSESDDLRKAISKKQADKIAKHKDKFIKGASEKTMDKATATAIFEDWEQFARYGFNKSHAADYGLISVQTAYLKTHYPAEYMSALMSVFKDDAAKVALYIADSRSMGIESLAPDVNHSEYDFTIEDHNGKTIEDRTDDKGKKRPAIRFGLGAVKNVGEGPVALIIEGRKGGVFKDLNDFARRVDLRSSGKRAIESLIKAGAFDSFGNRAALLAVLDQLVAASTSHFRAAEAGQLSLFGTSTGVHAESIKLPDIKGDRREMLNWERELIGIYLSDHPLSSYTDVLTRAVSHNSVTLAEASNQDRVRVGGMVVATRAIKTKTDKMMGFVTLEDLTGTIELVLFPRTWDKSRHLCEEGKIIFIDGKADTASNPPKVLVDEVRTDVTMYDLAEAARPPAARVSGAPKNGYVRSAAPTSGLTGAPPPNNGQRTSPATPLARTAAQTVSNAVKPAAASHKPPTIDDFINDPDDTTVPEPEFPPDWDTYTLPNRQYSFTAPVPPDAFFEEPKVKPVEEAPKIEPLLAAPTEITVEAPLDIPVEIAFEAPVEMALKASVEVSQPKVKLAEGTPVVIQPIVAAAEEESNLGSHDVLPLIVPPQILAEQTEDGLPPQIITVTLRPSANPERDRRRIKHLYGILISYPGKDRFSFYVVENGKTHLIDFPNDTTRICHEMLERLKKLLGEECWRVEEITYL